MKDFASRVQPIRYRKNFFDLRNVSIICRRFFIGKKKKYFSAKIAKKAPNPVLHYTKYRLFIRNPSRPKKSHFRKGKKDVTIWVIVTIGGLTIISGDSKFFFSESRTHKGVSRKHREFLTDALNIRKSDEGNVYDSSILNIILFRINNCKLYLNFV